MLEEVSDHEPHSKEINVYRSAECLFESGSKVEPRIVSALVEGVSEGNLLLVSRWQQPYLEECHEIRKYCF